MENQFLRSKGHCSTCDCDVEFVSSHSWLRDHFICSKCGSIPRERALMHVIETYFPKWREVIIHESSPGPRGASIRLAKECAHYIPSQYIHDQSPGSLVGNTRCENLETLTFADESVDLHVTQDVIEHVFQPDKVFKEIARTLKPGGMHIFTVPLVNKFNASKRRAKKHKSQIIHLMPEAYHGNPVGDGRSLVTIDWGFDIVQYIFYSCGLFTHLVYIDDLSRGIRAEFIEVLVTIKPAKGRGDAMNMLDQYQGMRGKLELLRNRLLSPNSFAPKIK